jgi:hypothetical protein
VLLQLLAGLVQIEPFALATQDDMLFPFLVLFVNYENVDTGPVLPVDTLVFKKLDG